MSKYIIKTKGETHVCNSAEKLKMYILCLSELGFKFEIYKKCDCCCKKMASQFIDFTKEYCKDGRKL